MTSPLPYDLCVRLKEAGWPQPVIGVLGEFGYEPPENDPYSPSLEELIEGLDPLRDHLEAETHKAEREKANELGWSSPPRRLSSLLLKHSREKKRWIAYLLNVNSDVAEGKTAKEAVAHLWLKLQEK